MKHTFIIGQRLSLRALEKSDINEEYLRWINDPEVTEYMVTGIFPSNMERLEEYYSRMTTSPNHMILGIVDKETGMHIGNITLNDIDWINRIANLGIMIGDKRFWGKGYGTEAIELLVKHAFDRLNLHKICLGLHACHKSAARAYQKAGFEIEGELGDELYRDGKYHNRLIMGITRANFYAKKNRSNQK